MSKIKVINAPIYFEILSKTYTNSNEGSGASSLPTWLKEESQTS
jgi:hypothetical protein